MEIELDWQVLDGLEETQSTIRVRLIIPRSWVRSPPALPLKISESHESAWLLNWLLLLLLCYSNVWTRRTFAYEVESRRDATAKARHGLKRKLKVIYERLIIPRS